MNTHQMIEAFHRVSASGSGMIPNRAGGLVCPISPVDYLDRFLMIGSTHNTYYASAGEITSEAITSLRQMFDNDPDLVDHVVDMSTSGRAPSNAYAVAALAIAGTVQNPTTKQRVVDALPRVARTGADFLRFVSLSAGFRRSWPRSLRRAASNWFLAQTPERLALQVTKYFQREGYTMRDVLRLSHVMSALRRRRDIPSETAERLFGVLYWVARGWPGVGPDPHPDPALRKIWAIERLRSLIHDPDEAARLIMNERVPREGVPTDLLMHDRIWAALLPHMPMMALIRNLANLTRRRLADDSEVVASIVGRLTDPTAIRQSRIHPVHYLLAHRTYARGYSQSSRNHWEPVPAITKALEQGLSIAFSALDQDPSPASVLIALDTSGSMSSCTGVGAVENMTAIEIGVFLAMVIARTFPNHTIWGFDTACHPLRIDPNASLDKALRSISAGGGTDISAPIVEAIRQRVAADALVIVTDNETWRNRVPIHEAMRQYREAVQRNTALVVIATSLTQYSVADPRDPNSLNIAGFDANIPSLIRCFAERTCSVQQPRQIIPEED